MNTFKVKSNILFAVDLKGIAIVNRNNGAHYFINYPEAALWSVLIENHGMEKSEKMIQAVIGKNEKETKIYIGQLLASWRNSDIIE
jgi:hypothetical protein